jgi:potassium voltage-gated channel KQT-like subfamily protein 1
MSNSLHQFIPVPTDENLLSAPSSAVYRRTSRVSIQTNNYDEEADLGSSLHNQMSFKHLSNPIQARIYNFLERPCGISCFLYHFTVFVIVIGCLVYSSILTVYIEQSYSILFWIEFVLFILFSIEYIVRVWSSGCRSKYRGHHGRLLFMRKAMCIVDLCVIIGYAILLCIGLANTQFSIQLVRYVRILQILRFLHVDRRLTSWRLLGSVIYDHRYELIATLYFCFIFLIVVAYLIWLVEKDETKPASEDMFHSFADTLWWAIVTMVS